MKTATAFLLVLLAGCASPYAPQEFHFSGITSAEMIESLRQREMRALQDAFVHQINPDDEFRL